MDLFNILKNVFLYNDTPIKHEFVMTPEDAKNAPTNSPSAVSEALNDNLNYIRNTLTPDGNFDVIIRNFKIVCGNELVNAFLVYFDGMVNKKIINLSILSPLMSNKLYNTSDIAGLLTPCSPLSVMDDLEKIISEIAFGGCAIFVDKCSNAFVCDVKGWGARGVEKPELEAVLQGPQEAFNESIMTNIGLIRKILKNPSLKAENIPIGKIGKTPCALMYIDGLTNSSLIDEVKRRLSSLDIDYIFSAGELELLLEDKTFSIMPQILPSERPERTASMLAAGKIVILLNGTPYALVVPAIASDFMESSEDNYSRLLFANFTKIIRYLGLFCSCLLPGFFIAITLYHREMLPTDLLFSIAAARESVPFFLLLELLLMEISFEFVREAGIRMPRPIGSSLGIIGSLILGQAAVSANIVSPILIIIVAISGIGSLITPTVALARAFSVSRFLYMFAGALGGFLGISALLLIQGFMIAGGSSFGVPFLSPVTPKKDDPALSSILVNPIWNKGRRPYALRTKQPVQQEKESRKWRF